MLGEDRITSALRGSVTQPDGYANPGVSEAGSGTPQSGYATPDMGPFECENCIHFDGQSSCNHPQVISDPEVRGQVEPEACCNFFQSAGNEIQAEEHGEAQKSE